MTTSHGLIARYRRAWRVGARTSAAHPRLFFGPCQRSAYVSLARFHYRAGMPLRSARCFALRTSAGEAVAVLVVSPPVLNGPWRRAAWPGWGPALGRDPRPDARALNASVRVLSRVVVDPRWRGAGVATRLVRSYLRRPLTPMTEALAAMGEISRFFEAAGMRRVNVPPARRDVRLSRDLQSLGLEPWMLAAPWALRPDARRSRRLARALRRWAAQSRATRHQAATASVPSLMVLAASGLVGRGVWVHGRPEERRPRARADGTVQAG